MNGKEILDMAANIIRRQDLDRPLLLFFINTTRRAVIRDSRIDRFFQYRTNVPLAGSVINIETQKIKNPRKVEWQYVDDEGQTKRVFLSEIYSYEQAIDLYGSMAVTGSPTGYLEIGTSLYILPAPTIGQINIYGEFWPADLTDSTGSSDITTVELPGAWVYLGAGEYFDMLGEADKAGYWRGKGKQIVEAYLAEMKKRPADTTDIWRRPPFGIPSVGRRTATTKALDQGNW